MCSEETFIELTDKQNLLYYGRESVGYEFRKKITSLDDSDVIKMDVLHKNLVASEIFSATLIGISYLVYSIFKRLDDEYNPDFAIDEETHSHREVMEGIDMTVADEGVENLIKEYTPMERKSKIYFPSVNEIALFIYYLHMKDGTDDVFLIIFYIYIERMYEYGRLDWHESDNYWKLIILAAKMISSKGWSINCAIRARHFADFFKNFTVNNCRVLEKYGLKCMYESIKVKPSMYGSIAEDAKSKFEEVAAYDYGFRFAMDASYSYHQFLNLEAEEEIPPFVAKNPLHVPEDPKTESLFNYF